MVLHEHIQSSFNFTPAHQAERVKCFRPTKHTQKNAKQKNDSKISIVELSGEDQSNFITFLHRIDSETAVVL